MPALVFLLTAGMMLCLDQHETAQHRTGAQDLGNNAGLINYRTSTIQAATDKWIKVGIRKYLIDQGQVKIGKKGGVS